MELLDLNWSNHSQLQDVLVTLAIPTRQSASCVCAWGPWAHKMVTIPCLWRTCRTGDTAPWLPRQRVPWISPVSVFLHTPGQTVLSAKGGNTSSTIGRHNASRTYNDDVVNSWACWNIQNGLQWKQGISICLRTFFSYYKTAKLFCNSWRRFMN